MRAEALAVQLLDYGHTVEWTANATTLPRHTIHRLARHNGFTWHEDSDTMRRNVPEQAQPVRELIAGFTELLDTVTNAGERRRLRADLARWVARLERELYPTTQTPTPPPPPAPARRGRPRKDRTNA